MGFKNYLKKTQVVTKKQLRFVGLKFEEFLQLLVCKSIKACQVKSFIIWQ